MQIRSRMLRVGAIESTITPFDMGVAAKINAAYTGTPAMSPAFAQALVMTARRLGTSPYLLANLINAESRFNHTAVNAKSGASGLVQFIPSTATALGTSIEAVRKMTAIEQLALAEKYLRQYLPLDTPQRLYLAVFYPKAQNWPAGQEFPESAWKANPWSGAPSGYIKTPTDYVAFVDARAVFDAAGNRVGPVSRAIAKTKTAATTAATAATTAAKTVVKATDSDVAPMVVGMAVLGVGAFLLLTNGAR